MKVQEYRDLTVQMFRVVDDWSACIDDEERGAWAVRASRVYVEFVAAVCSRATERDIELHALAAQNYKSLTAARPAAVTPVVKAVPMSRAEKYNRSVSRSVRLARAARSAMRRGYF